MLFNSATLTLLSLAASSLVLASPTQRRQCQTFRTVSDPGFYVSGSIPTSDFPDDPPYFENQILEFQPTLTGAGRKCTLFGNFERGFPVRVEGNTKPVLDVYQRRSSTNKVLIGTFSNLPEVDENGELPDIVSAPLGTVACTANIVFEFQMKVKKAGAWANIAFEEDALSGFDLLAC